jgi:hypothetical protein
MARGGVKLDESLVKLVFSGNFGARLLSGQNIGHTGDFWSYLLTYGRKSMGKCPWTYYWTN